MSLITLYTVSHPSVTHHTVTIWCMLHVTSVFSQLPDITRLWPCCVNVKCSEYVCQYSVLCVVCCVCCLSVELVTLSSSAPCSQQQPHCDSSSSCVLPSPARRKVVVSYAQFCNEAYRYMISEQYLTIDICIIASL